MVPNLPLQVAGPFARFLRSWSSTGNLKRHIIFQLLPFVLALAGPTQAAVYSVTNTNDSGPGSLRQIIADANAGSPPAFILLTNISGVIMLQTPLPVITAIDTSIVGPGRNSVTVSGSGQAQIFNIAGDAIASISGLTIADGFTTNFGGGGILNNGTLTISNCLITRNHSSGVPGGGVFTANALTLVSSDVVSNLASGLTFASTPGQLNGFGGGLCVQAGLATVSNCTFSGNSAMGFGGGVSVTYFPGEGMGGAVYVQNASLFMTDATLSSNLAQGNYGEVDATVGFPGGDALGGAICSSTAGSAVLLNCTLSGNTAQGGPGGTAWHYGGNGGNAYGGGVCAFTANAYLTNCTLVGNQAIGGAAGAAINGGWYSGFPGVGLGSSICSSGAVTIVNTILESGWGEFRSGGHNLIEQTMFMSGMAATDITNVPAQLGPLQDNGGPTLTQQPQLGSPALDAVTNGFLPPTDQRGFLRPYGTAGDIGAVEFYPYTFTLIPPEPSGSNWHLQGRGFPLTQYRIQASSDLNTWSDLTTNMTSAGGVIDFLDTEPIYLTGRLYRVAVP